MATKLATFQDPIFQDENCAREALEAVLWPDGVICRHCGNSDPDRIAKLEGKVERPEWITPAGRASLEDEGEVVLTPRQREILALLAQGHSNKEIGLRLDVVEITVKMHVSAIFRALNVANRTQAVLVARRLGILQG